MKATYSSETSYLRKKLLQKTYSKGAFLKFNRIHYMLIAKGRRVINSSSFFANTASVSADTVFINESCFCYPFCEKSNLDFCRVYRTSKEKICTSAFESSHVVNGVNETEILFFSLSKVNINT